MTPPGQYQGILPVASAPESGIILPGCTDGVRPNGILIIHLISGQAPNTSIVRMSDTGSIFPGEHHAENFTLQT
jgi:hypothetical protein